jgi:hypothetical protein
MITGHRFLDVSHLGCRLLPELDLIRIRREPHARWIDLDVTKVELTKEPIHP